jgi:hypothetical protein
MSSLLAHLAAKFSDQDEVVATDALAFILRNSVPALRALEQLLGAEAGEHIPVARVSPQHVAGDESRPDLATFAADGTLTAFVEAKFWAGLTEAQPVEYLRRLREKGGKFLLFVVPEERITSVSATLAERTIDGNILITNKPTDRVSAAATLSGRRISVIAWKHLLVALTSACGRADDRDSVANLDQLSALVARFESEGFGAMSRADLSDLSVPRRVRALAALVQAVVAKGKATSVINLAGTQTSHGWTSAGRYLALQHGNAWFGVDHDAWARYKLTPLWLWFPATPWGQAQDVRRALQDWEVGEPKRLHVNDDDDSVSVPLFLQPAAEREEMVEHVIHQLEEVDRMLAAAGLVCSVAAFG